MSDRTCRTCRDRERHGCVHLRHLDGDCLAHHPMRVYIIGPYRADTELGIALNVGRAAAVWRELTEAGYHAFCPHTASGPLDFHNGAPLGDRFWLDWTLEELRRSDACVLVPDADGLTPMHDSLGAAAEWLEADALRKPVYTLDALVPDYGDDEPIPYVVVE